MALPCLKSSDRIKAAAATVALEVMLGYTLIAAFWHVPRSASAEPPLKLFDTVAEPPPPVVSLPPPVRTRKPEGAASPANLTSVAAEIVAPPPTVPLIVPPVIVTADRAAFGNDFTSGAAAVRGPGTGSGGLGTGTGSGNGGLGDGGRRKGKPPRRLKGRLKDSDYPRSAAEAGIGGTVSVLFAVETDGRVSDCEVTQTSGHATLDEHTCRLIVQRYRFKPAQDAEGRPVRSRVIENHSWVIHPAPSQTPSGQ